MKKIKLNKLITAIASVMIIAIAMIFLIYLYDKLTVNNQYYISEKNLDIPIFVYHDIVADDSQVEYDYMQTTAETFENQIQGLEESGYHFITYQDLYNYKNGTEKLYKKSCIITFDDGYEGVYQNAYPLAKKYNIPMTVFLVIDDMEKSNVLTWEETRELDGSGLFTIASHSMEHPEFTKLSVDEAEQNVNKSYDVIDEELGRASTLKIFTYPYGLYTDEQIQRLWQDGYIQNLTDNKVNTSKNLDLARLHRCYPLSDSTLKILVKIRYRLIRYGS